MTAQPDLTGIQNELARRTLLRFTEHTFDGYRANWHHKVTCEYLDKFVSGEITRLMIFMPPQTGKSELASRRLPSYLLGKNPDLKIGIISYNMEKARSFNREVQRIIDSEDYSAIFPDTKLYSRRAAYDAKGTYLRNADAFEIVGHEGKLIVAGVRTRLTGETVDVLIADDLVKDYVDAQSPVVQLRNIEWWDSVAMTRLHNESKVLLLMTRWSGGDIPGRILTRIRKGECEPYTVLVLKSIKEDDTNEFDPREIGDALWPERHSLERLKIVEKSNPSVFRALHQQDPSVPTHFRIWFDIDPVTKVARTWRPIKEMPDFDRFYGVDFGFTNAPTAVAELQHHKGKGYAKEIIYEPGLTNPQIAEKMKAHGVKHERVYCDSASPKDIEELKMLGINAIAGISGQGSVNTQILFMKTLDMHYVETEKNHLKFELENHAWQAGPDGPINLEVDNYNHLTKAIMYGFYKHLNEGRPGILVV